MFLNVQGRVLFDAFISKSDSESYVIECDSQIVDSLINHLKLYKVRRKLNFEKLDSLRVWALFNDDVDLSTIEDDDFHNWYFNPKLESTTFKKIQDIPKESKLFRDPRLAYLGHRIILPDLFTKFRHKLGVGEGAEDLPRGKYLPLEANCDYLHGVSFQKGCYIGQELTARTYHTGVIRRRFMPIVLDSETPVEQDAAIVNEKGKSVGKYINSVGKYGIASFRINDALKASSLKVGSITVKVEKPGWWPSEVVSRQSD
ncbi:putative transferase CAF17-like protein, mitochondrial [Armadillidium vulgare]|nr:putative transferase CAF17-like protein, mitochondrial [Armadillidium vulgare]